MKRALVFAVLLVLGCIEMPGAVCPVSQYLDQGVAVTYLDTDFDEILAGNPLKVRVDVGNLGEAIGRNVRAEVVGPDNFYLLGTQDWGDGEASWTASGDLYPPDPQRCLEGGIETGTVTLMSRTGKETPSDGVRIRLKLNYDYKSQAWADLIAMDEMEWNRQVKTGQMPQGYQWQSAAPIKVKIIVPDSPVVLPMEIVPLEDRNAYPIRVRLEYALIGEAKAVDEGTPENQEVCAFVGHREGAPQFVPNCVKSLKLVLQKGLAFDTDNPDSYCGGSRGNSRCVDSYVTAEGDNPSDPKRAIDIDPAKVSPNKNNIEEYVLWVKVADNPGIIQKTYKITAEAQYTMEVVYDTNKVVVSDAG